MKRIITLLAMLALAGTVQAACNDCVLQVEPVANSICQGESAVYDIRITNIHEQSKAFSLSAAGDIALSSDLPGQVTVGPFETKTVRAVFTPVEPAVGQHRLEIALSGYGASDSDDALFNINDCYTLEVTPHQSSVDLCEGSTARVDLTISNRGQRQDTYSVFVRNVPDSVDLSLKGGQMSLAPGASRTVSLTLEGVGDEYGTYGLEAIVQSARESAKREIDVNLLNCYHVTVSGPEEFTSCPDAGMTYTAEVKNHGCVGSSYQLGLQGRCRARLGRDSIYLGPGESKEIAITVEEAPAECELTVSATSAYDSDSSDTLVKIKKCYDVELDIVPDEGTACRGQPVTYDIKVKNTGYYADEYALGLSGIGIELDRDTASLASGEEETVDFTITGTWCVMEDEIPFTAVAQGEASDSDDAVLRLLPFGESSCASIELAPAVDPCAMDCWGGEYIVYVKNTGYVKQTVTLTEASGRYRIQPERLVLKPKESRPVALYIMPAEEGLSETTIIANSQDRQAFLQVDLDFEGPVCKVSRPVLETEEPSLPIIEEGEAEQPRNETTEAPVAGAAAGTGDALLALAALLVVAMGLLLLLIATRPQGKRGEFDFPEFRS